MIKFKQMLQGRGKPQIFTRENIYIKKKQTKEQKLLKQILANQRNIMIWISSNETPYYKGYFAGNIKNTEELIE
jgi:hypothetical protein